MRRCIVLAACVFFIAATAAHADFYRWVDKDGKEFFSNELEKVPQEYRGSVQTVKPDESRVSIGDKSVATSKTKGLAGEHKDKNGRGEEYWHKQAANLRLKLRDQQDEYNLVLKELENQSQKPRKLTGKKNKSLSGLEKKKLKLEQDMARTRRKLDVDLPEEARRADAYPGWLRE
jgi:uncharacterized protein DUF4124